MTGTPAKMEVTLKVGQLPSVEVVENNWKRFVLEADGRKVSITVKPKVFAKLEQAQAAWPQWVAAITGQMGQATEDGFVLLQANIQTFEKKAKQAPEAPPADKPEP